MTVVEGGVTDEIRSTTTVIVLESPTSMRFAVQDLEPVAAMAQECGITAIIDNTWPRRCFKTRWIGESVPCIALNSGTMRA